MSNIPWEGPVGAVRVGWVNNEPVVNPDRQAMAKSKLDLIVTAKSNTDVGKNFDIIKQTKVIFYGRTYIH